jgi:hypothetical protein
MFQTYCNRIFELNNEAIPLSQLTRTLVAITNLLRKSDSAKTAL